MSQKTQKVLLLFFLISLIILFFIFDINQYSSLENIKIQYQDSLYYYDKNKLLVHIIFIFIYIITTSLSLPFALGLTLIGGALFGFFYALILVSFGSTIGATIAFLLARFIGYEYVKDNYKNQLSRFYNGFKKEGAFYLFAMRMVPIFPFFIINIVTALMPIKIWTFYWVSQVGMLPGTALYVYAGTQLSKIKSLSDIMSPTIIITFIFVGFFPMLVKEVLKYLKNKRIKNNKC